MVKRLFQGIVLFFALYAFAFMPLGKRTALEHIRAVLGSPEAKQAATELQGGATRLVRKLRGVKEPSKTQVPTGQHPGRSRPHSASQPGVPPAPRYGAQPGAAGKSSQTP